MKKHISLTKFTCFVLLIAMIASVLVAGTYAKYTSTASGTNATVVATWSFQVNGEEIAVVGAPKTIAFGLFDTINDSDGVNAETDVSTGLIAPGTSGSFEFALQNTSDVTAQYGIDFTVTNEHDIPIEFSLDGVYWSRNLQDIEFSNSTILPIGSGVKTVTVMWRWAFDGDADKDTDLGTLPTAPTITVEATVTAQQLSYIELDNFLSDKALTYYSTLTDAVNAVNDATYGTDVSVEDANPGAAIYTDEEGNVCVVLLEDYHSTASIQVKNNMILNLGGNALTFSGVKSGVSTTSAVVANLIVDGTIPGSKIETFRTGGEAARAVQFFSGECAIIGGTYISHTEGNVGSEGVLIGGTATATISDATIIATETSGDSRGLVINAGLTAVVKDCYITGTHSAINALGAVYIDGGIYESAGHGGIYFSHKNATSYVRDAVIRYCEPMAGYTDEAEGINLAGMYIGGSSGKENVIVYMDNCEISGPRYPIVMRGGSGEKNNSLYISNSTVNTDSTDGIRIDNDTLKLNIGPGNNFTDANTDRTTACVATDEDYSQIINAAFDAINASLAE